MPLNWNFPAKIGPKTGKQVTDVEDLMHRLRWLADRVLADNWFAATVLPQLHVLAWGNKRGI
jgi:7-carboxy-7-deazaguanine synthase